MSVQEQITEKIQNLSENKQQEVLTFVESLLQERVEEETDQQWNRFSLNQAMIGLENDGLPEYNEADLKEKWQSQ